MKLLLKAALKGKKHTLLIFITILSLFFVTIAGQMEMFAFGALTDRGADFFTLFGSKKSSTSRVEKVTREDFEQKWDLIDVDQTGSITKQDAMRYLGDSAKDISFKDNPIKWAYGKFQGTMGSILPTQSSGLKILLFFNHLCSDF